MRSSGWIGLALVSLLAGVALIGPALDPHAGVIKDVARGTNDLGAPLSPSSEWLLGTDALGRCVTARLAEGAGTSLAVGAGATALALVLGLLVGLVAGYRGGAVDAVLMRGVDLFLAFPFLLLVIALAALLGDRGAGTPAVVAILAFVGWTPIARVVRAKVLALRAADFVAGARAAGASPLRIVARHLLPNVFGPVLVLAVTAVGNMILAESTLAYVGLGAPPPAASWGRMLAEGQPYMSGAPWLVIAPGAAIMVAVLAFNLLGEGLRAALDPRS